MHVRSIPTRPTRGASSGCSVLALRWGGKKEGRKEGVIGERTTEVPSLQYILTGHSKLGDYNFQSGAVPSVWSLIWKFCSTLPVPHFKP